MSATSATTCNPVYEKCPTAKTDESYVKEDSIFFPASPGPSGPVARDLNVRLDSQSDDDGTSLYSTIRHKVKLNNVKQENTLKIQNLPPQQDAEAQQDKKPEKEKKTKSKGKAKSLKKRRWFSRKVPKKPQPQQNKAEYENLKYRGDHIL